MKGQNHTSCCEGINPHNLPNHNLCIFVGLLLRNSNKIGKLKNLHSIFALDTCGNVHRSLTKTVAIVKASTSTDQCNYQCTRSLLLDRQGQWSFYEIQKNKNIFSNYNQHRSSVEILL